jgi:GxxExxY protein
MCRRSGTSQGRVAENACRPKFLTANQRLRSEARMARLVQTRGDVPLVTSPTVNLVIGCAIDVHRALGPGLLESAYERCLAHKFKQTGLAFRRQVPLYRIRRRENRVRLSVDFIVETRCCRTQEHRTATSRALRPNAHVSQVVRPLTGCSLISACRCLPGSQELPERVAVQ